MITHRRWNEGAKPLVSVDLAIVHLRIDDCSDGERELLQCYLESATELAERYTGRAFVEQTVEVVSDSPITHLPVQPVGDALTAKIDGSIHTLDEVQGRMMPRDARRYMDFETDCYREVRSGGSEYRIEYEPTLTASAAAKQAVLQMVAWLYENRGDVSEKALSESGAEEILSPLKCMSIG